jgi:hypothetical protein
MNPRFSDYFRNVQDFHRLLAFNRRF